MRLCMCIKCVYLGIRLLPIRILRARSESCPALLSYPFPFSLALCPLLPERSE